MKIERPRPTVLRVTMHVYEMAALVSAARWIAGGARGEVPEEIRQQLEELIESYEDVLEREKQSG